MFKQVQYALALRNSKCKQLAAVTPPCFRRYFLVSTDQSTFWHWHQRAMSVSHSQASRIPNCTNGQRHALVFGQAQYSYPVHTAGPPLANQTVSHPHGTVPSQDPFTYYKAFLGMESPSNGRSNDLDQHDDGDAKCGSQLEAQPSSGQGDHLQNMPRSIPYNLAVRFANRSNGVPLATIIEQGSVSTLNSHGSLLSVGHFPSIRTVENVSPVRALHRHSRSLDENVLNRIQEEEQQEPLCPVETAFDGGTTRMHNGKSESRRDRPVAPGSHFSEGDNSKPTRLPDANMGFESKRLKSVVRGVLTSMRSGPRTRSRSSSSASNVMPPNAKHRSDGIPSIHLVRKETSNDGLQGHYEDVTVSKVLLRSGTSSPHCAPEQQVAERASPDLSTQSTTAVQVPILPGSYTEWPLVPQLPPLDLSRRRSGKEPTSSLCPVLAEPRDAALEHVRHASTTFLSPSRDKLAARYTPDGTAMYRNEEGSLRAYARNSSRNASFCSTMSTSYSGTVLGIDLDLQEDFPHSSRRSITPVWFSPKETTLKVQEPPKRDLGFESAKPLRPRSITSSALTSLLPIAAAEGIVQQDFTTPQLSFYSPSGNLIQTQDTSLTPTPASSYRSRSDSHFLGKPATTTSYYNVTTLPSARSALSAAVNLPPARQAPVPLNTPPQLTAPLPDHIRHHHNYQHAEKSQIGTMSYSEPTFVISSGSQVRGCGGVFRPTSLDPHSGVPQSPQKHSRIGYSMSCFHLGEVNRSRFNPLSSKTAATPLCRPETGATATGITRKKGNTLKKRQCPPHAGNFPELGDVGLVAGHALRVCFCQPLDGSNDRSSEMGCGGATMQECDSQSERQAGTPNARIPSPGEKGRPRERTNGRTRSDSAWDRRYYQTGGLVLASLWWLTRRTSMSSGAVVIRGLAHGGLG
ncbi:hypothetical protein BU23DRAFT_564995 [Bimuria novae-zelandiae CBS 107.79]|uniref:Uncharacterized protein n=1 Tax=Bimuria novae-zelandiae CBS 107.79 TaxID=1447943 RepID=A0A6A5VWC0_9PLEO|nr:hypothetical protein BU23DRAFT_564995 [Bimuria novae-zelandiae CBS 107.79]